MRCPLCAGPLREETVDLFKCEVGHELRGGELHQAATARASVALWMAIEALDTEAEALRRLSAVGVADAPPTLADQAEADARLLRKISAAHVPPGTLPEEGDGQGQSRLDEAVRAVSLFLVAEAPLGETLNRIAVVARDAVTGAAAAGITLLDARQRPTTSVWTDELSPAIDHAQYADGTGPCLDAYREGRIIRVDDTQAVGERWPAYSAATGEHGVLSTLSLPLRAAGDTFGALNLYATQERGFDAVDESDAEMFATQVSVVLANARAYWDAFDLAQGLRQAMDSRAVIEQAKGILMAAQGCDADEAFATLARASQNQNWRLRAIATRSSHRGGAESVPATQGAPRCSLGTWHSATRPPTRATPATSAAPRFAWRCRGL